MIFKLGFPDQIPNQLYANSTWPGNHAGCMLVSRPAIHIVEHPAIEHRQVQRMSRSVYPELTNIAEAADLSIGSRRP